MLCSALTEDIDKGVGQEVAVVVRDITLIHSTGSRLNTSKDYGVVFHLSALVPGRIC